MNSELKQAVHNRLRSLLLLLLLGGMAAGSVWAIIAVPAPIVDRMLEADIRQESELWKRRLILHMENPEKAFEIGAVTPFDARYLTLLPETSHVYRFRMLNRDGMVFWSTRPVSRRG